jgi:tetratricopeptide (TPR) repeat protein
MADSPRIEELKRRVQVDPASIAFAALAEEYRRAGRFEEAIATCQAGLQRHPAYLSAHVTLGRALLELGRFDEARQELEHVLRAAPENLAAIRGLAEIHHRRGELPEALEQYRSALSVAKHDAEIEDAVDQISRQVAPPAAAAPVPVSTSPASAPADGVDDVSAALEAAVAATEDVPAPPEPVPAAPEHAPVAEAVAVAAPEPVAILEPVVAPSPPDPVKTPERRGKPTSRPHLELVARQPRDAEPAEAPVVDPALSALEDLLAAILREKTALGAGAESSR